MTREGPGIVGGTDTIIAAVTVIAAIVGVAVTIGMSCLI